MHADKHVAHAQQTQTDAAVVDGIFLLRLQGVPVNVVVDHVIQKPRAGDDGFLEGLQHEFAAIIHETFQIDAAQVTAPAVGQWLLGARVGRDQGRNILPVVVVAHRVPEQQPRFSRAVRGGNNLAPQFLGLDGSVNIAAPAQVEVGVLLHGVHELVGQQHRNIGIADFVEVLLDADKFFDVGMIDPEGLHIRPAPSMLGNGVGVDGKQVHKSGGAARLATGSLDRIPGRTQNGQIVAASAAVLVGFGFVLQGLVNALDGIAFNADDIAVVERGLDILPAGAMHDAASGDKSEIDQDIHKLRFPGLAQLFVALHRSHGPGLPDP